MGETEHTKFICLYQAHQPSVLDFNDDFSISRKILWCFYYWSPIDRDGQRWS